MDDILRQRERDLLADINSQQAYQSYLQALLRRGIPTEDVAHFIIAANMLRAGFSEIVDESLNFGYKFDKSLKEGLGLRDAFSLCEHFGINYPIYRGASDDNLTFDKILIMWHQDWYVHQQIDESFSVIYVTPQGKLRARNFLYLKERSRLFPELHVFPLMSPEQIGLPDDCTDPKLFLTVLEEEYFPQDNYDNEQVILGGYGDREIKLKFGVEIAFEKRGWMGMI